MAQDRVLLSDESNVLLSDGTSVVLLATESVDGPATPVIYHQSPAQTASYRAADQTVNHRSRSKAVSEHRVPGVSETSASKAVAYTSPNRTVTEG